MDRSTAVLCVDIAAARSAAGADRTELQGRLRALEAELAEVEPVVAAALITATAFRLRDEASLIEALRALVEALERLERVRAEA